jgi:hypothetical protein
MLNLSSERCEKHRQSIISMSEVCAIRFNTRYLLINDKCIL